MYDDSIKEDVVCQGKGPPLVHAGHYPLNSFMYLTNEVEYISAVIDPNV